MMAHHDIGSGIDRCFGDLPFVHAKVAGVCPSPLCSETMSTSTFCRSASISATIDSGVLGSANVYTVGGPPGDAWSTL